MKDKKINDPSRKSLNSTQNDRDSKTFNNQEDVSLEITKQETTSFDNEGVLQNIYDVVSQLATELFPLKSMFENRLRYDKTKEEAFNRLYTELDDLKKNSIFDRNRPLFIDLILLYDRIENKLHESKQPTSKMSISEHFLKTLSDELLEILNRQEIEVIRMTSTIFDPLFQRAIGTEFTTVKDENNEVAKVLRKGFKFRDRLLRAEEVIVKKFKKNNKEFI
jgi:molecular chaperone GrpE